MDSGDCVDSFCCCIKLVGRMYIRIWPLNDKGKGNTIKVMSFNIDGTKDDFA